MKPIMIAAAAPLALALLAGCAGPVHVQGTAADAPKNVAAASEVDFIAPDPMLAPPGTYEMEWEPKAPPPEKKVRPRKMFAKPDMVSQTRRRLFVLPTTYEH